MNNKLRAALIATGIWIVALIVSAAVTVCLNSIRGMSQIAAFIAAMLIGIVAVISIWIRIYKDML